jgi:hypothetical protein
LKWLRGRRFKVGMPAISGGTGDAESKIAAMEPAGIKVSPSPARLGKYPGRGAAGIAACERGPGSGRGLHPDVLPIRRKKSSDALPPCRWRLDCR